MPNVRKRTINIARFRDYTHQQLKYFKVYQKVLKRFMDEQPSFSGAMVYDYRKPYLKILAEFIPIDGEYPVLVFYIPQIEKAIYSQLEEDLENGDIKSKEDYENQRMQYLARIFRHEFRHYQQWQYFKKYNLDWADYNQLDKSTDYDEKVVELDAMIYSEDGKDMPLAAIAQNYCCLKLKQLEDLESNAIDINTFRSYCYEFNRFLNLADEFSTLLHSEKEILEDYDLDYSNSKIILASIKQKGELICQH